MVPRTAQKRVHKIGGNNPGEFAKNQSLIWVNSISKTIRILKKVRTDAETFYATIDKMRCPYFGEDIAFNAKGLRHLKFKADQQARPHKDQYSRLKLIRYAPEVLKLSRTVQGIWSVRRFEEQRTNSRWERVMKEVTYYEFIAVLDSVRVKVIVKEVVGGEKHFWSIIPFWGIDKNTSKRILHSGDLEYD